ncbi:MAG: FG-GAP-like repeat-containing protein [Propionibacteriaceae bacterium]|nr:FG-GAP-like repeat-containing protein [Propionibacteriaceae bacterium]
MANAYSNIYLPTLNVPIGWTGSVSGCNPGSPSAAGKDAIITAFNYMRAMAGLPSVTENTAESAATQAAALMMQATQQVSHTRTSSWACYTAAGARSGPLASNGTAGGEIITQGATASAIPLYMLDPGSSNQELGHRAAILTPQTSQIGVGSTSNYNAIHWIYDSSRSIPSWVAWPSQGYFPYELVGSAATRWSFYPKSGSAANAHVSVTKNGAPLSITNSYPAQNAANMFSGQTGLGWDMPTIAQPANGGTDTYQVTISGISGGSSSSVTYSVYVFAAAAVTVGSVSISGTPAVNSTLTATATSVSPSNAALNYTWYRGSTAVGWGGTYVPVTADSGQTITVTVTASVSNYTSGSASASVKIGTLPPISGQVTSTDGTPVGGLPLYYDNVTCDSRHTDITTPVDDYATITASASGAFSFPSIPGQCYQVSLAYGVSFIRGVINGSGGQAYIEAGTSGVQVQVSGITSGQVYVTGNAQVGQTLTASVTSFTGTTLSYQWYRGATPISGATGSTYTLVSADYGTTVSVKATGTLRGYASSVMSSPTSIVTAGPAISFTPTISGNTAVGSVLTVSTNLPTGWSVSSAQWFSGSTAIPGATGMTYRLTSSDIGTKLWVQITATGTGFNPATGSSAQTGLVTWGSPTTPMLRFTLGADMTGDGRGEILAVDSNGILWMFPGQANGSLAQGYQLGSGFATMQVFGPGDLNGDGKADILAISTDGNLWLYPGNGSGQLGARVQVGSGWTGWRLIPVGDLNGDGKPDLLGINPNGLLFMYAGLGTGKFAQRVEVGWGWTGWSLYAAGDLNGDGKADILGINANGLLYQYTGKGNGTFNPRQIAGNGWNGYTMAGGADLNGDGKGDILGRNNSTQVLYYYQGMGNAQFAHKVQIATGW